MNEIENELIESGMKTLRIQEKILKKFFSKYFIIWGVAFIIFVFYYDFPIILNKSFPWFYYAFGYPLIIVLLNFFGIRNFKTVRKYIKFSEYFKNEELIKRNRKININLTISLIIIYIIISLIFSFNETNLNLIYYFLSYLILYFIILLIGLITFRVINYTFDKIPFPWIFSLIAFIFSNLLSIIIIYIFLSNKNYSLLNLLISILWFIIGIIWIVSGVFTYLKEDSING